MYQDDYWATMQAAGILRKQRPTAHAMVAGDEAHPGLRGMVRFYQTPNGVMVAAEVRGLPVTDAPCGQAVFGFHIHAGGACSGNAEDPFADAGTHYNPQDCPHPSHAGDLPPLFGNGGSAWMAVLTARFTVEEIIGKTVIIHSAPDDFTTQPSGNSGHKIACGLIRPR